MSSFFDSELVQQEMEEINDLQAEIYKEAFKFPELSVEEKIEHLERLDYLLEKQEILYTRLKLSDDPRAKQVANNVRDSAIMMGMAGPLRKWRFVAAPEVEWIMERDA